MKKIIMLLLIVALVLVLIFVPNWNRYEGAWKCTYYALYSEQSEDWNEQGEGFRNLFTMKIYDDGKVIVNTSGNENEGTYTTNKDTLNLTIKGVDSQYVLEKNILTLVNHPRAKIEYTKIGKIEKTEGE